MDVVIFLLLLLNHTINMTKSSIKEPCGFRLNQCSLSNEHLSGLFQRDEVVKFMQPAQAYEEEEGKEEKKHHVQQTWQRSEQMVWPGSQIRSCLKSVY